jgi:hypothetical protein
LAPWDWLTDEEVTPEELEYRDVLRQSVMAGEVPLEDTPAEKEAAPTLTSIGQEDPYSLANRPDMAPVEPEKEPPPPKTGEAEWAAFEENMDDSYAGKSDSEIDEAFRVQAQEQRTFGKLNKAEQAIRGLDDSYIPKESDDNYNFGLESKDTGLFGNKMDEKGHGTLGPVVGAYESLKMIDDALTPDAFSNFMKETARPAVKDALEANPIINNPVAREIAKQAGVGKQYEAASDFVLDMAAEMLTPDTFGKVGLTLTPGVGELRGGVVAIQSARTAGITAQFSRLAVAETIGAGAKLFAKEAAPEIAGRLTTQRVRDVATEAKRFTDTYGKEEHLRLRDILKEQLPDLNNTQLDSLIITERLKGYQLANEVAVVKAAQPDELVTVYMGADEAAAYGYHWTPTKNVDSIQDTGLRPGSWLADSPEKARQQARLLGAKGGQVLEFALQTGDTQAVRTTLLRQQAMRTNRVLFTNSDAARVGAMEYGIDNPSVVEMQVRRGSLQTSGAGFTLTAPPVSQRVEALAGQVQSLVRTFLRSPEVMRGERGSFKLPNALPAGQGNNTMSGQWHDVWGWVDPDGNFTALRGHNHKDAGDIDTMKAEGWIRTNGSANPRSASKWANVEFMPANGNDKGVRKFLNGLAAQRDPNINFLIRNEGTKEEWKGNALEWIKQGRPVPGGASDEVAQALEDVAGLPPGVETQADLEKLLNRVTQLAKAGEGSRFWYETSAAAIKRVAQGDIPAADKLARITAWTSTNSSVSGQGAMILRGFLQAMRGESTAGIHVGKVTKELDEFLQMDDAKTVDFISGLIQNPKSSRAKLGNFYTDLLDDIRPDLAAQIRANTNTTATIDRWMNRAFGFTTDSRTPAQYAFMGKHVVGIAKELGWTPKQVQAAIWVSMKAEDEGVSVLNNFDYADSFRRHMGQISWETMPGANTNRGNLLKGLDDQPLEVRAEIHMRVQQALMDDDGNDIIARILRLPVDGTFNAPGIYKNASNPSAQTKAFLGTASGSSKLPTQTLDPRQREVASDYAAAIGYILEQNAVAWTRPLLDAPSWRHNALDINIGRLLDDVEAQQLAGALGDEFAVVSSENGAWIFRILDDDDFKLGAETAAKSEGAVTAGAKNKAAHAKIQEAINQIFSGDTKAKISSFATDGDYIESKVPDGSDYLAGRSALERPEVRAVLNQLKERVGQIDAEFAARLNQRADEPNWWASNRRGEGTDNAADLLAFGDDAASTAPRNIRGGPLGFKDVNARLEFDAAQVARESDSVVREQYAQGRGYAAQAQDEYDRLVASPDATPFQIEEMRQRILEGIKLSHIYGEELANRTNGAEGMSPKIRSAIKKLIGDETGALNPKGTRGYYIRGVGPVKPKNPLGAPLTNNTGLAPMIEEARQGGEHIIPKVFNMGLEKPSWARKLGGALAPGYMIPRVVLVAQEARKWVEAQVPSFVNPLARSATIMNDAWAKTPAVWKGTWDDAQGAYIVPAVPRPHVNTVVDFLERPWEYDAAPELLQAQAKWDEVWDDTLVRLHDEYGIDIEPFYGYEPNLQKIPFAPRRGSYVPHMDSVEFEKRLEAEGLLGSRKNMKSTAKEMLEKERGIASISERVQMNPDFEPELDLNTIAVKYGSSAARAAGKHTENAIIGGKNISELMEELHPQLMQMREAQIARVQNTRNNITNLKNALFVAGYTPKRLQSEINSLLRAETKQATKIEATQEGFEHIAELKAEFKQLQREAKAYKKLVNKVLESGKLADAKLDQTGKLRDRLTMLQQKAIDKLDTYDQKIADAAAGADDATRVTLRTKQIVAQLEGRIKGLQEFSEGLGDTEGTIAENIDKLTEKLEEYKKASIAVTMPELGALQKRIEQMNATVVADAMQAMGAQRVLRSRGRDATAQLKNAVKKLDDLTTTFDKKQSELEVQLKLLGKVRAAVDITKQGVTKSYRLDPVTRKYVHPRVAEWQGKLADIGGSNRLLDLLEEGRAVQLSTGDLSPVMYGRSQMGAFAYLGTLGNQLTPVYRNEMGRMHVAMPKIIAKGLAQGDQVWEGVNQEYLRVYQGVRGRPITMPLNDIRGTEKLRGAERILTGERGSQVPLVGGAGRGLRKMNDVMTRVATFAEFSAWETSVRKELLSNPNMTLVEAGEGVYKGMRNVAPSVDFTRLGYSPAMSRMLNAGFTSLSYIAASPQFTVAYPKSLGKLGVKLFQEGLNPVDAWRALGVADRETIIHGTELMGTLSVISGTTAALFGEEFDSTEDNILDAVNPLGKKGWTIQLPGGQSIPLAAPLRAGIRTAASTAEGLGLPVNSTQKALGLPGEGIYSDPSAPIKYATNRLISGPSIIYHLATNKDWQGRDIRDSDDGPMGQLLQAIGYGMESVSIVTAPTVHALRTGEMGNAGTPATPMGVFKETLESHAGVNIYDPSRTTQFRAVQNRMMETLIEEGVIPPELAPQFKELDYTELPSGMRKLIDQEMEEKHPDLKEWYEKGRRESASPFQIAADKADLERAKYAKEFDILQQKLFNGEDPKVVWEAYEIKKAELRGALGGIYNTPEYNDAIKGLEGTQGDLRKIEDDWFAITEAAYSKNAGAMSEKDYQDLAKAKAEFIRDLAKAFPDKANLFVHSLKVQEEVAEDEAHPMEQLRKAARRELTGYYAIPEEDTAERQKFLQSNPSADVARWMTSATESPALNSVEALERAFKIIPKREIHLSGSNQHVTEKNLPIFKQYAKEITRMFSLPASQPYPDDPSRSYSPRTELRKQSPLYDAIWFWLGMNKPDPDKKDNAVPVYHPQEVFNYVTKWGLRTDKANIRSY